MQENELMGVAPVTQTHEKKQPQNKRTSTEFVVYSLSALMGLDWSQRSQLQYLSSIQGEDILYSIWPSSSALLLFTWKLMLLIFLKGKRQECKYQLISLIATHVTASDPYLEEFYKLLLDASHTADCSLDSGQRWRYHLGTRQIPLLRCSRV